MVDSTWVQDKVVLDLVDPTWKRKDREKKKHSSRRKEKWWGEIAVRPLCLGHGSAGSGATQHATAMVGSVVERMGWGCRGKRKRTREGNMGSPTREELG